MAPSIKSDADLFSMAMSQIGKQRLHESTFSQERFGSILSEIKTTASERIDNFRKNGALVRAMPRVLFDYTGDPYLDALAYQDDSLGFIALSGCGVAVLHIAMYRLLSRRDLMEEIGDPGMEDDTLPFIPLNLDYRELIISMLETDSTMSTYIPRDRTRMLTARVMAKFAVEFIIIHEFRHISAGHLGYWHKITGRSFISELTHSETKPSDAMVSQAMEMDADSYGIVTILSNALLINSPSSKYAAGWRIAVPDDKTGVFLTLLSAYIVFKLFDVIESPSQNWLERSHPPPAMRSQMLMTTVHECFIRWNRPDLSEWLPTVIQKIIDIGERQMGILLNVVPDKENLIRISGAEGQSHVKQIMEVWSTIEAEMALSSYVDLSTLRRD